jgi:hypothetical protein
MLLRVALLSTNVSEEISSSSIRVTRIDELGTTLAVISNVRQLLFTANVFQISPILVNLMMEVLISSETSVLTRATLRNIPEQAFLYERNCIESNYMQNVSANLMELTQTESTCQAELLVLQLGNSSYS